MRPVRYAAGDRVIRVDPDNPTNQFREVNDNSRAYRNQPAKGRLPGFGNKYDTCGTKDAHFCSDCGKPLTDQNGSLIEIGKTCWRKDCPRCAPGWAMRASYTITSKIEDYRINVSSRRNGQSPKYHHVTLIPPYAEDECRFGTATDDPLSTMYQIAKTILNNLGVMGGAMVYHPFSGTSEDDRGEWRRRLFKNRDWDGDVRDELHYRPHIHAIVVADTIDHLSCKWIYEKTGWITHRIHKKDSNVSLYGRKDLASAVTYALSHAGVGDSITNTYRYFGDVAQHTASETVEDEMRAIVRKVAPTTLDINLGTVSCNRPVSDTTGVTSGRSPPSSTPDPLSTAAASDDTDDEAPSDPGQPPSRPCGGRLVPIEHAESFIGDVEFDSWLSDAFKSWESETAAD